MEEKDCCFSKPDKRKFVFIQLVCLIHLSLLRETQIEQFRIVATNFPVFSNIYEVKVIPPDLKQIFDNCFLTLIISRMLIDH